MNANVKKFLADLKMWLDENTVIEHVAGQTWVIRNTNPGMINDIKDGAQDFNCEVTHQTEGHVTGWDVYFKA